MRLRRIRIQNYRSIQFVDFEPGPLCALVGENNAGKSNVLRALNLILGDTWPSERMFSEEDFYNYDTRNEIVIEVWGDSPHTISRYGVDLECMGLRITVGRYKRAVKSRGKAAGDLKFDFVPIDSNGREIKAPEQRPTKGVKPTWAPIRVSSEIRDAFPFVYVDVRREYARHTPSSRWSVLSRLFAEVNEDFQRSDNTVTDENGDTVPRRVAFQHQVAAAFELLRTAEFKRIEEVIRTHALQQIGLDPASSDVRIEFRPVDPLNAYKSLSMILREGALEFDASNVGAGYQSSIVVAIFRAYQEIARQGAIIAIEEPEIFLHPQRQRFFYKVLSRLAESGSQVFYTTHSAHFVDVSAPERVVIVRRTPASGTTIATCPARMWEEDKERLKIEKEFDPERNEMFFAKGVLLVEGDTEKVLYPALLKAKGIDLDEVGISVVEAGGKPNLPVFLRVLERFNIPYVVVYDEDQGDERLNEMIRECITDHSRAWMYKPNLETEIGYKPRPRESKVQQALDFARNKALDSRQQRLLFGPLQRLLEEVRPDLAKQLPQPMET